MQPVRGSCTSRISSVSAPERSTTGRRPSNKITFRFEVGTISDESLPLAVTFDFVTPLLTPLTYEGLIDEIIGNDFKLLKAPSNIDEIQRKMAECEKATEEFFKNDEKDAEEESDDEDGAFWF